MKQFAFLIITLFTIPFNSFAQMNDQFDLSVFPSPKEGYVRFVINLPTSSKANDSNKIVEFYVGKNAEVDNCNSFGLIGEIRTKNLEGFGYTYYEFETDGTIIGTMKYCKDSKTISKFVIGKSELIQYNSRIPIIIDVPQGYEVRYKIFEAKNKEFKGVKVN